MAAKAPCVQSLAFTGAVSRPRRDVWYESDEPVVLPRSRRWNFTACC